MQSNCSVHVKRWKSEEYSFIHSVCFMEGNRSIQINHTKEVLFCVQLTKSKMCSCEKFGLMPHDQKGGGGEELQHLSVEIIHSHTTSNLSHALKSKPLIFFGLFCCSDFFFFFFFSFFLSRLFLTSGRF